MAREVDKRRGKVVFDSGFDEPFSIVAGGSRDEDGFVLKWCLLPEFQIEGSLDVDVNGDDRRNDEGIRDHEALASFVGRAFCSR